MLIFPEFTFCWATASCGRQLLCFNQRESTANEGNSRVVILNLLNLLNLQNLLNLLNLLSHKEIPYALKNITILLTQHSPCLDLMGGGGGGSYANMCHHKKPLQHIRVKRSTDNRFPTLFAWNRCVTTNGCHDRPGTAISICVIHSFPRSVCLSWENETGPERTRPHPNRSVQSCSLVTQRKRSPDGNWAPDKALAFSLLFKKTTQTRELFL